MESSRPSLRRRVTAPTVLLALLGLLGAVACVPPPAPPDCVASSTTVQRDVAYRTLAGTPQDLLSLDVYDPVLPAGCEPAPVVVWVHGGGWHTGDKANNMFAKVVSLATEGYAVVSVNYRLSPAVSYPTHNGDVAAAVAWVHSHAAAHGIDPTRISLVGHSAGAGIVASLAADERYLQGVGLAPGDLACVVALDTEAYDVAAQAATSPLYQQAFGTDPAVWVDASPLTHVADAVDHPDTMVVTRGTAARIRLSQRYHDAVAATGARTVLVNATPLTHEGVNDAVGAPGDTIVTPPLLAFLSGC